MTKYRFTRGADGHIYVRAERKLGKQLVASITKVVGPEDDISTVMKQLHGEVRAAGLNKPIVEDRASERSVGQ